MSEREERGIGETLIFLEERSYYSVSEYRALEDQVESLQASLRTATDQYAEHVSAVAAWQHRQAATVDALVKRFRDRGKLLDEARFMIERTRLKLVAQDRELRRLRGEVDGDVRV